MQSSGRSDIRRPRACSSDEMQFRMGRSFASPVRAYDKTLVILRWFLWIPIPITCYLSCLDSNMSEVKVQCYGCMFRELQLLPLLLHLSVRFTVRVATRMQFVCGKGSDYLD